MSMNAPKLYNKSADQVINEIESDIKDLNIGWEGRKNGPGWALVRLFGRLSELMVNRLNLVPDKHFFAFLNTAGIDFVPPSPATTELSFTMVKDGPAYAVIPKGAQMATMETESSPEIVFETDRTMVLSPNSLTAAFAFDTVNYADVTAIATGTTSSNYPAFDGDRERKRYMYLSDPSLFVFDDDTQREAATVALAFTFLTPGDPSADGWTLSWQAYDGEGWNLSLDACVTDGTKGFSQNGTVSLSGLPSLSESEVDGNTGIWIRCILTGGTDREHLPVISDIRGSRSIHVTAKAMTADNLFSAIPAGTTFVPQDQENDFFPFGQRPSRLDAFYIQLDEALNKTGGTIGLSMNVDHAPDGSKDGQTALTLNVDVVWEYFGKDGWESIYSDDEMDKKEHIDFLSQGRMTSQFTTPSDITSCKVNGQDGYWIRAKINNGLFETQGQMVNKSGVQTWDPPKFYAPVISDLEITLDFTKDSTAPKTLAGVAGSVDDYVKDFSDDLKNGKAVSPFLSQDEGPALYLGFNQAFPKGQWIQIRIDVDEDAWKGGDTLNVSWDYDTGRGFSPLRISDGTCGLLKKGYLGFFAPEDHAKGTAFGNSAYYIRVVPEAGFSATPFLKTIRTNTIPATNSVTVNDAVMGSSDGKANQSFTLKKTPVMFGVELAVLEPDIPPDEELTEHKKELAGIDTKAEVFPYGSSDVAENKCWVRWIHVEDFFSSKPESRHFTVDAVNGEIRFGDGIQGAIPPLGVNNIKVVAYKSHNGSFGNVDKDQVVVVRNPAGPLENIKTVTNAEASAGGSDEESPDEIRERGPQRLKHRERSVTWEDYEWLAREASSEIRSAACFPVTDTLGQRAAGHVTVVITPESKAKKPTPGPALLRKVKSFIEAHSLCNLAESNTANAIHVTGPSYVACTVKAKVAAKDPEESDQVELDILTRLDAFLNPLTGGPYKTGWRLGRDVFLSEISAEIEAVDGVDHVEALTLEGSLQQYTLTLDMEDGTFRKLPFEVDSGSQVSTFDERIKFLLADPLFLPEDDTTAMVTALTIYGFAADDTVAVVNGINATIKENMTLASVSADRITFETPFDPPAGWDQRDALISEDGQVRVPLSAGDNVILTDEGKVAGLILTGFQPGDKVCVVAGTRRDPVLEFLPLASVTEAQTRVYIPETCLAYSGSHDIDMVL